MKQKMRDRYIETMKRKQPNWDDEKINYEWQWAKHILIKGAFALTILVAAIIFLALRG